MTGSPGPRGANGTNVGATVAPEAAGVGAKKPVLQDQAERYRV